MPPSATTKPAKGRIASLGIGGKTHSSAMRRARPRYPAASMTEVTQSVTGGHGSSGPAGPHPERRVSAPYSGRAGRTSITTGAGLLEDRLDLGRRRRAGPRRALLDQHQVEGLRRERLEDALGERARPHEAGVEGAGGAAHRPLGLVQHLAGRGHRAVEGGLERLGVRDHQHRREHHRAPGAREVARRAPGPSGATARRSVATRTRLPALTAPPPAAPCGDRRSAARPPPRVAPAGLTAGRRAAATPGRAAPGVAIASRVTPRSSARLTTASARSSSGTGRKCAPERDGQAPDEVALAGRLVVQSRPSGITMSSSAPSRRAALQAAAGQPLGAELGPHDHHDPLDEGDRGALQDDARARACRASRARPPSRPPPGGPPRAGSRDWRS